MNRFIALTSSSPRKPFSASVTSNQQSSRWLSRLFAFGFAVTAASSSGFELPGYKSLKFGASQEELRNLGFKCNRGLCQGSDTLFGRESSVFAFISDGSGLNRIDVSVGMAVFDMIRAFTEALGEPKTYVHPNMFHQRLEASYWVSDSLTAIVVKRNLDEPASQRLPVLGVTVQRATAYYLNSEETEKMLQEAKRYAPKPRDF